MRNKEFAIPKYTTSQEIKEVRKSLKLTQQEFADLLCCSKPTVVRWESNTEPITGPVVFAIYALMHSDLQNQIIIPEMKYNLRLTYYHRETVCTVIDVDETKEKIDIINYNNNTLFQAFGANKKPTFQDYNEFLASRCFPPTRDKIKTVLADLNLPFYDPLMIIEKTAGKMAEDDFWIKVERK